MACRLKATAIEALHESLLEEIKLLTKCFRKTVKCYVDVDNVQLTFSEKYGDHVSLFSNQMLSIETLFLEKIAHLYKISKEMASFLIAENISLATSYPDVCMAHLMYLIVPVTVATEKRSFSKLKLIQNFL